MQKRIQAVIISLLMMPALMAQDIHSVFEKSLDYINCKAVKLLVEKSGNGYTFECNCNGKLDYKKIVQAIPDKLMQAKELAAEIDDIKKNSVNEDDLLIFLTQSIFYDSRYQKVINFKDQREKDGSFGQFKIEISDQVTKILQEWKKSRRTDSTTNGTPITIPSQKKFIVLQIDPLSIFIALTLVILLYFLVVKNPVKSDNLNKHLNEKFDKGFRELAQRLNDRNLEIIKLQDQVKSLDQKLSRNTKEPSTPRVVVSEPVSVPVTVTEPTPTAIVEKSLESNNIQYASVPEQEGYFIAHNLSGQFKPAASIYKIVKQNDQYATFEFEDREEAVGLAIGFPNYSINPVCEELNAHNPKAKRIITKMPGKLKLKGDKWIVIEKAKIIYE